MRYVIIHHHMAYNFSGCPHEECEICVNRSSNGWREKNCRIFNYNRTPSLSFCHWALATNTIWSFSVRKITLAAAHIHTTTINNVEAVSEFLCGHAMTKPSDKVLQQCAVNHEYLMKYHCAIFPWTYGMKRDYSEDFNHDWIVNFWIVANQLVVFCIFGANWVIHRAKGTDSLRRATHRCLWWQCFLKRNGWTVFKRGKYLNAVGAGSLEEIQNDGGQPLVLSTAGIKWCYFRVLLDCWRCSRAFSLFISCAIPLVFCWFIVSCIRYNYFFLLCCNSWKNV